MNLRAAGESILWGTSNNPIAFLISTLMKPFGALTGKAAQMRAELYRCGSLQSFEAEAPIVSIGNLTLGGSGKTPLVIALARELSARGRKTAIITRGYGGSRDAGVKIVSPDDSPMEVGDEPLLMVNLMPQVTVIKSGQRVAGVHLAESSIKPHIYLLDDGFGHLALKRDLDILLVDNRGFGNGRVFPAGPLREPLSEIKRAQVIVVRDGKLKDEMEKIAPGAKILKANVKIEGLAKETGGEVKSLQTIENKKVFSFCGIGNPQSFTTTLEDAGIHPVANISFPDHHIYSEKDIARIERESAGADIILTTEKDLARFVRPPGLKLPLYAVRIKLEVTELEWLMQKILNLKKSPQSL